MLTLPPKLKQAIGNGVKTSLYPIVKIYPGVGIDSIVDGDTESLNLSIKETNISGLNYKPLLLNIPTIKSSADIVNSKYTISSVSLSISNSLYKGLVFSDDIQSILNSRTEIYYCANGITDLEDCLLIYTGTIRRFTQSKNSVNLTLEDLTEEKLETKIPSTLIEDADSYSEDKLGQPYPMVYGYVDKSPTIINTFNDIEIDKPSEIIFGLWDKINSVNYQNPYITGQNHPLLRDQGNGVGWLTQNASLSVFTSGYLPIMEKLGHQFGSRQNTDPAETIVYEFENATTTNSAKINLNENVFLYEEYAEDSETQEVYGKGNIGVPTRIYRPIEEVSFYVKNHFASNLSNGNLYLNYPRSCNKFFGYTGNSLHDVVSREITVYEGSTDNYLELDNDETNLDPLYDDNWENGDKTWWKPTEINTNVASGDEHWANVDTNWTGSGYEGKIPVNYIQNNDHNSGLHINSQYNYLRDSGAFARLKLNQNVGSFPCVTKILYNMHYHTPSNEVNTTYNLGGVSFYQLLYYHPICFWVERQLINDAPEDNTNFGDMDEDRNNWHKNYDTEDWVTECQVPNHEHSFFENSSEHRYTTDYSLAGDNYDNIILGFNDTSSYDSINVGMPNNLHTGYAINIHGSAMASLRNVYVLQDCLVTDIYNQDFFVSVVGRKDGSDNVYTKPQFILSDILTNELSFAPLIELPSTDIDDDWISSFTLNEQKEAKNVVENLFKSSVYIPSFNSKGELKFINTEQKFWDKNNDTLINNSDIINYSYSLTKLDDIKNQINIKYKKDYGSDEFLEQTGYEIKNNDGNFYDMSSIQIYPTYEYNTNYYGISEDDCKLEFESEYIRDEVTARKLQRKLLMWYCNQHLIIKLDLSIKYIYLEVGDTIRFDQLIGNNLAFGNDYTTEYVKNGQLIFPSFFIKNINKSNNKVSIEAVQLHRCDFGLEDGDLGLFDIPNHYDNNIYEPEIEQDFIFDVQWDGGINNVGRQPINAIVETNLMGDIGVETSICQGMWVRSCNQTFDWKEFEWQEEYKTFPQGNWSIGAMPVYGDTGIINREDVYSDTSFGGFTTFTHKISNHLELINEFDGSLEIVMTAEFLIGNGSESGVKYVDFIYQPGITLGDLTGDQVVNILDVVNLVQYILGQAELDDNQLIAADLTEDGIVNILDIVTLVQVILGTN